MTNYLRIQPSPLLLTYEAPNNLGANTQSMLAKAQELAGPLASFAAVAAPGVSPAQLNVPITVSEEAPQELRHKLENLLRSVAASDDFAPTRTQFPGGMSITFAESSKPPVDVSSSAFVTAQMRRLIGDTTSGSGPFPMTLPQQITLP